MSVKVLILHFDMHKCHTEIWQVETAMRSVPIQNFLMAATHTEKCHKKDQVNRLQTYNTLTQKPMPSL